MAEHRHLDDLYTSMGTVVSVGENLAVFLMFIFYANLVFDQSI